MQKGRLGLGLLSVANQTKYCVRSTQNHVA
jgi:hypothetical protein